MKITVPVFDVEIFEDKNEVELSKGALIGQWYVNSNEAESGFMKRYKEQFPEASPFAAAHGYDMVMHFAEVYKKGLRGKDVATYFHDLKDFKGALGTYSASGDNRFTLPATVKIVREDGFEKVK